MARRRARGLGQGPNEVDLEAADLSRPTEIHGAGEHDTPTVAELHQVEGGATYGGPDQPIPVDVQGVVRTDELPCRTGGIFTRTVATLPNRSLLGADPKRKLATIVPIGGDIRLGSTQAEAASDGAGGIWPNGVPLLYSSSDELWAAGVGASRTVTVIVENWAL